MLSVYNNVTALDAQRSLNINQRNLARNMGHLSSGMRINDASDDAAGLAISEQMRCDIRSWAQAARNANDGVSMMQVANGAMNQQVSVLTRMKELATEAANGTLGNTQLADVNAEFQQLLQESDRIANSTQFNGQWLLKAAMTMTFQVGTGASGTYDQIDIAVGATDSATLTISGSDVLSQANAVLALASIDKAVEAVSSAQAIVGAGQNRLTAASDNASAFQSNLQAAESRIRDVDVAFESAEMSRNNILVQAGTSVLAQANQLPQAALKLLGG
jgi:flagellin